MATLRNRNGKKYLCWYEGGKERRKSLGDIPDKDAEIIRQQKELITKNNNYIAPNFETFALEYLKWHKFEYPDSHTRIHQLTHQYLIPEFGLCEISQLDRLEVENYKHTRKAAPTTIGKELRTLQAILNKAVEWRYIGINPIKGVKPPRDNRDSPPPYYQINQIKTIYKQSLDPVKKATWMLFFNTGIRRAEGLNLEKEWIDERGIKILSTTKNRTKSGKWRIVPHTKGTKAALRVLNKLDGNKVLPQVHLKSISRAFDNCLNRAKLDGSLHWTRHTYASHLVMAGEPLIKVQKLLGHSSIKTTEKYSHLSPDFMSKINISL